MAELDNLSVIIVGLYSPPPADDLRISMSDITSLQACFNLLNMENRFTNCDG